MTGAGAHRRAWAVAATLVAIVVLPVGGPAGAGPGAGAPAPTVSPAASPAMDPSVVGPPAPGPRIYRPPVDAPVVDPFRPPPEPWLAGNRGLEYATVPGTPVGAIGPGVVVFAGPVAGSLYVTVLHPDGLRSSYSYLAAIRVAVGDRVLGGQVVGITGSVFHLGVRRGDEYLDPALLFGSPVEGGTVFLVPLGGR